MTSVRALTLFVAVLFLWITQSGVAHANLGLARNPAQWSGPHALGPANLTVEREQLQIVCAAAASGQARCQFQARYLIFNAAAQSEHAVAAFCGTRTRNTQVRVNGKPVLRTLREDERAALEGRLDHVLEGPLRSDTRCSPLGFELTLDPAERREVVAEGVFEPGLIGVGSYAITASDARHAFVRPRRDPRPQRFQYLLAPVRTWQSVGAIEIEVRLPASWHSDVHLVSALGADAGAVAIEHRYEGDEHVMRMQLEATSADALDLDLSPSRPIIDIGGPTLGVGGAFGSHAGFRLRAGWELTGPDWLLYGVAADTNFGGLWVVAPTIEAASDFILILPSCGVGFGLPVRITPHTAIGLRGQLSMMFAPVGLSFGVDVFPRDTRPVQMTLLGQISL